MGLFATTTSFPELMPNALLGNSTGSDTYGATMLSVHIDRAEGIVRAYLSARYDLSKFSVSGEIPPLVRSLTEDITCFRFLRGARVQEGQITDTYSDKFKDALDALKLLRDGKMFLTATDGSTIATRSTARYLSSSEGHGQIFGLDDPTAWKVDQDLLDSLDDSRD